MDAPDQIASKSNKDFQNKMPNEDDAADPPPATTPVVTYSVTLLFDQENGVTLSPPKRQQIAVSAAFARVLARAATLAPTSEPPLQFSTLLIGMLVDEDQRLDSQFKALQVNFSAIASKRSYDTASLRDVNERSLAKEYLASISARKALEEAQRIANATSGPVLHPRHLMAAYPVLADWHLQDFENFEIDRLEWARTVGAEMAAQFPGERKYWERYADRASPVPLTSFSADVYTQEDLLDIDRSVESLALVMASTRTVTPLAIGVFGPWGSGKSFFMRHLQRCIDRVRHHEQARINRWIEKRREGPASVKDAPLYFGEIAQVEFNAWQYNEGNLVASLVEHLFRNLRHLPDNGDGGLKARRDEMLMKLDAMQREAAKVDKSVMAAEKDVTTARNEVDKAAREAGEAKEKVSASAREIQSHRAKLDTELARLDDALRAASLKPGAVARDAVIAVALEPLAPFFAKVQSTVGQARDQIFDWQDFFDRVFTTKGLVVIGLCVAVPLVMLLNDYLMAQWTALAGAVALAIKGLGSALDVFKESRRKFEETLAALDKEQQRRVDEVASKIRQQQQSLTDSVQREISALSAELDTRRRNLADREAAMNLAAQNLAARAQEHEDRLAARLEAEEKMRAAQDELDRLSSSLLLDEFLTDRATTDEYRKQLGILAQVRHDIERLSGLIEKSNKDWLALDNVDKKVAVPPVSRIVLYIDDLDRCKESTVLAVLEAVHLLLAFPLFVCAVAVDPRWVEKCLRETRKQMFIEEVPPGGKANGAAVATVGDYLEKIFQIPIWMSPIESKTRAQLVTKLLGPTAAPAAPMAVGNGAIHGNQPQGGNHQQTNAFETLVARVREKPDPLEIHADEAAFIDEISDLLSDRPRALKRFVNTYRLLKASLPDIERAAFVTKDPSSPHRACLVQLAFFTSRSRLAGDLIAKLEAQARRDAVPGANGAAQDSATLGTWIEKAFPGDSPVRRALEAIPASATIPLGVFQHWLPCTSRYLFHRAE